MEMHQVRYTLGVARALNFTKAAETCHASQPALSKAVKSLEAELGAALFHREGKQVIITEFGRSMIPHLQRIADETEMAAMLATNFKLLHKVPIRLGVLCTVGPVRLSRFLASVQQQNPGIELAVRESTVSGLLEDLDAGELDFAVLGSAGDPPAHLNHILLYEERYVVVFPPDHRLSSSNLIPLQDLSGEPYVDRLSCEMREMVMAVCRERAIEVYATFRSEREDWVQSMVMARMGFAFMPEYSVTLPGLLQRPLVDPEVKRRVSLVHKAGRQFSPAASAFAIAARSFDWPG